MDETMALIEQIIREHQTTLKAVKDIDGAASDVQAIAGIDQAKDTFMPGRFDQKQGLEKLDALLGDVRVGLDAHFGREENALLKAFEQHGTQEMVTALNDLLAEHEELRARFAHDAESIGNLVRGSLGGHQWAATAQDMRAHLSHTRRLLETHAASEQVLLGEMKQLLSNR